MGKVEQAEPTYTHYGSIRGVVEQWQSAINAHEDFVRAAFAKHRTGHISLGVLEEMMTHVTCPASDQDIASASVAALRIHQARGSNG